MTDNQAAILEHLDMVIRSYRDFNFEDHVGINAFTAAAMAAIERAAGNGSVYAKQADLLREKHFPIGTKIYTKCLFGIVKTLRDDVANGRIASFRELIHGELFGDFLEMADHLLSTGYKDAAAVIAGSVIEAHLRQLCVKHGVDIEIKTDAEVKQKKADRLNSDLASAEIHSKLDQKSVTAWLDLRNKAAHGKYDEYTKEQVAFLIQGIRDFITRNPA